MNPPKNMQIANYVRYRRSKSLGLTGSAKNDVQRNEIQPQNSGESSSSVSSAALAFKDEEKMDDTENDNENGHENEIGHENDCRLNDEDGEVV